MGRGPRLRRMLAGLLVVLTSLGAVITTVALWTRAQALNSDRWAELSRRIIREPDVVRTVSARLSTAIVDGLDVEARLRDALSRAERLPPQVELLAAPAAAGLQRHLEDRIGQVLGTPQAQDLWVEASTAAHDGIVRILRDETGPGVIVGEGTVSLDLIPLINRALAATQELFSDVLGRRIELPTAEELEASGTVDQARLLLEDRLGVDLPAEFGEIEVFSSDRLEAAQTALRLFDLLVVAAIVTTIVLLVASLVVSTARRRTLVQLAIGLLIGSLIARLVTRATENAIVDLASAGARRAVGEVVGSVFSSLVTLTTFLLAGAGVVAVAAYLAGRPTWFVRLGERARAGRMSGAARRAADWARNHSDGLRLSGVAAALVVLSLVGLSLGSLIAVLVGLGLFELGVSYVQRAGSAAGTPAAKPPSS